MDYLRSRCFFASGCYLCALIRAGSAEEDGVLRLLANKGWARSRSLVCSLCLPCARLVRLQLPPQPIRAELWSVRARGGYLGGFLNLTEVGDKDYSLKRKRWT